MSALKLLGTVTVETKGLLKREPDPITTGKVA